MTEQDALQEKSELRLVLTEKFTETDASEIRAALNRHLRVSKPGRYYRASIDPPSVIKLLGAAALWLPLVTAATAFAKSFFSTLGKRMADAAWDSLAARKEHKDIKPLIDVVNTLVSAADHVEGRVYIDVGLDIPDDFFGTAISTESRDPLELARILIVFRRVCGENLRRGTGRDRTRAQTARAVRHGAGARWKRDDPMDCCVRLQDLREAHTVDNCQWTF